VSVPTVARALPDAADPLVAAFALDVAAGFARTPRMVPPRWLYDDLGSTLFEAICRLPWYRITRAERAILDRRARAIIEALGDPIEFVELGGGNGEKLDLLLDAAEARGREARVTLIDISQAALDAARERLKARRHAPGVSIARAPYEAGLASLRQVAHSRLVVFLGSNIGNSDPSDARDLLLAMGRAAGPRGAVLLGADLVKPEAELLLAYDDPLQITAAFNRNLIVRINRELGATIPIDAFSHRAVWNAQASRVEMHLVAGREVEAAIPAAAVSARFARGDYIWTESSYKYTREGIERLARDAGLRVDQQWIDPLAGFALSLLRRTQA